MTSTPAPRLAAAALIVVSGVALPASAAARTGPPTDRPERRATVVLDGVAVALGPGTTQVVTVNHTRGHHARVTWWIHTDRGWQRRRQVRDGRIGYGGLVRGPRRQQGSGTTPLGTYRLISAFGTQPRQDAWALGYRRIRRGDYWVQDNGSDYYNRYRNKRQGGFRWWLPSSDANSSERLSDYGTQYELAVVTSYNRRQVRHRGAGIFLHVNGAGATAGCVSVPRRMMVGLMDVLDATARPVIAIGR